MKYNSAIKKKWKNYLSKSKVKECYKVKNVIKSIPFKLHYIQQCGGVLRAPSKIWDGDSVK